jgi:hypothetical protein
MTATMRQFLLLAFLVIAGRVFDVTTTYLYTPDLQNETNVLVVVFGAGWTSVIIIQSLLVLLTLALLYYYLFRFKPDYPGEQGLTVKQFASYLFFNDTVSFSKIWYKTPKNYKVLFAMTGYVVSMTLISVSILVGTSTTLLLLSDAYKHAYRSGVQALLFIAIGGLAIWFTIRFFRIEYRKYERYTETIH